MTKTLLPFNKKQLSIVRKYNEDDIKLYEEALKRFK
jgi:hypothetical protein